MLIRNDCLDIDEQSNELMPGCSEPVRILFKLKKDLDAIMGRIRLAESVDWFSVHPDGLNSTVRFDSPYCQSFLKVCLAVYSAKYTQKVLEDVEDNVVDLWVRHALKQTAVLTFGRVLNGAKFDQGNARNLANKLNTIIGSIKESMAGKTVEELRRLPTTLSQRNGLSAGRYIDKLFAKYARLLVLRIDFGYSRPENRPGHYFRELEPGDVEQVQRDRDALIRYFQTDLREHGLVGYMWKVEWQELKGYHFHTLLFMDGSQVRNEAAIGRYVEAHWKEVTEQQGYTWNCNLDKSKYGQKLGVGMIHASDEELIFNLKHTVATYLTKPDAYVRPLLGEGFRMFGRSCLPKAHSGRGRPRMTKVVEVLPVVTSSNQV